MNKNKVLYSCGVIISILVIISVLTFLIFQKKSSKNLNAVVEISNEEKENETQTASTTDDKSVENLEKEKFSEIEEKSKEQVENEKSEEKTKTVEKKIEENITPSFVMPVDGEIIRDYAKDKLVYSDTLKEWVTHLGIDIKAKKTSVVKSSSAGKITAIKNDPRFGLSVVIEHTGGYSTVYSNLLTAEFVTVGEEVDKGETIGTVGNTAAFEILDEPHLHFEIKKDGIQVDPNMYL